MSSKLLAITILLLSPLVGLGQSGVQIQTEKELASALTAQRDTGSRQVLLRTHTQLINTRLWSELSASAAKSYYDQSAQRCLENYQVVLEVATELRDPRLLGTTYYNLGRTYSGLNQFQSAIQSYERSLDNFTQAGRERDSIYVLADLGALYFIQEDYRKAAEYSERSIAIADGIRSEIPSGAWPDQFGRARSLETLAEIDTRNGDHEAAIQKLQRSLALFQQLNTKTSTYDYYIAGVYAGLGRAYPEIGDSARALFFLNKALEIAKAQSDADMIASLRNDIGYLYMEQEDYAQANVQFAESLKIYSTEKNKREEARVLLNLGVVEQRRVNYDEALRYFRLSLKAATATGTVRVQIADNEGLGVALTAKKDFAGALEALNQGLAIAKETGNKARQGEILWRSAQVYYAMENYTQSTTLAERAVELARTSRLPKLTYLTTTTLGESYAAQRKYDLAIETLKSAVQQLEALREQIAGSETETQLFLENKVASYHALLDLFIRQGKTLDALMYAEKAKARVLLDVLSSGKADLKKVLTTTEKAETQSLNQRISEINETIKKQETGNSSSLSSLYAQLDAARLDYQSFQDSLYVAHPDLRLRSGQTPALTVTDLNTLASDSDTAYLEYVVAGDQVSLFVLTKGKSNSVPEVKVYPLSLKSQDLIRKINEFHDALAEQRLAYATAARELYTLLIAPAEQQLGNVRMICIVPDSFLWNVPFQALMAPNEHFLIEDHALYYAPSLSVLGEMNRKKGVGETTNTSLIAFGNPVVGKDEQRNADLCPLPEAEQEVNSIAKSFDEKSSRVLIGRDASEKSFKSLAPTYSIIHLATHGVIDNRQPLYSHLLLTKTEDDPENDGRLEARQIMDMNLNADLAVLSACETANGTVAPGEGVIGMSWAFFVAGTRSMVVSQWKISSASTSEFMTTFYENLNSDKNQADRNKAQAIQRAALTLLRDSHYRHPFYWAGFVMIGRNVNIS